jgi:hypothetical protein
MKTPFPLIIFFASATAASVSAQSNGGPNPPVNPAPDTIFSVVSSSSSSSSSGWYYDPGITNTNGISSTSGWRPLPGNNNFTDSSTAGQFDSTTNPQQPADVPEPEMFDLFLLATAGTLFARRRNKSKSNEDKNPK